MGEPSISLSEVDAAVESAARNKRAWIFQLIPRESSTLLATFGGWALDGMDVIVYSFVIPSLIAAWHISQGQAGLLGMAQNNTNR